jgi:hypothetical protein
MPVAYMVRPELAGKSKPERVWHATPSDEAKAERLG